MERKLLWMMFCFLMSKMSFAQFYDIIPYEKEGKWGLINAKKQFVVFPKYDSVGFNDTGSGFVVKLKDKYGLLEPSGAELLPLEYNGIFDTLGFFVLTNRKKRYFYDPKVKRIFPWTDDFLDDKILSASFTDVNSGNAPFRSSVFSTQKDFYVVYPPNDTSRIKKDKFFTLKDEGIFPSTFEVANKTGIRWGKLKILAYNDKSVWAKLAYDTIPPLYDTILVNLYECSKKSQISNNCIDKVKSFLVKKDGKWGIIGEDKEEYLKPEWDFIERRSGLVNGNATYNFIQKDGLWGWIESEKFSIIRNPEYPVIRRVPTKIPDMFYYVETTDGKKGYVKVNTGKAYF